MNSNVSDECLRRLPSFDSKNGGSLSGGSDLYDEPSRSVSGSSTTSSAAASTTDASSPSCSRLPSPSAKPWAFQTGHTQAHHPHQGHPNHAHLHRLPPDLSLLPSVIPFRSGQEGVRSDASVSSMSSYAPSDAEDDDETRPPPNFHEVGPGLYRSSFPRRQHFEFIRSLGLKTVLCFTPDPYPQENIDFLEEEDITFHQIPMPGNKEETIRVAPESISAALRYILNPSHYPLLIHCNKGKHRTGCVVGCIRKLQNWDFQDIVEEYRLYSTPKSRPMDEQCIGQFEVEPVWHEIKSRPRPPWLVDYIPVPKRHTTSCEQHRQEVEIKALQASHQIAILRQTAPLEKAITPTGREAQSL